jgi:hypothetical protein
VRKLALGVLVGALLIGLVPTAHASPSIRTSAEALADARRIYRNAGPQVAQLLGVPDPGASFSVANLPAYFAARTTGSRIVLDRSWATTATDADLRGAVLHELVHVFESTPGNVGSKAFWSEALADAVRFRLNRPDADWNETRATRRLLSLAPAVFRHFARDLADGKLNGTILRSTL